MLEYLAIGLSKSLTNVAFLRLTITQPAGYTDKKGGLGYIALVSSLVAAKNDMYSSPA